MSLRRRLLVYLLLCAPAVWAVALAVSVDRARHEVNELFDTEMIRLARLVYRNVDERVAFGAPGERLPPLPADGASEAGDAEVGDMTIAAWDASGRQLLDDGDGMPLPRRADAGGFVEMTLDGEPWRVYYLSPQGAPLSVATGQKSHERQELVLDLVASQMLPWLLVLPALLAAMAWAVRRALAPVCELTEEVRSREADDLKPVPRGHAPLELQPLVDAMNALFARIGQALERERRFTADAAHELRTPLAVLRAQWDVYRRAASDGERAASAAKLTAGMERMDRLVTQMLALSRLESASPSMRTTEVRWPAVVEQAMSECLALAERRRMELACEWPPADTHPMPLIGDEQLLVVMLRNLLDNALRYAPSGTLVRMRFTDDRLEVENDGEPPSAETLAHLGERFHRPEGQVEGGSGLGVSLVRRIAALHGLRVEFGSGSSARGFKATVSPDDSAP